jgi:hypothetical protein
MADGTLKLFGLACDPDNNANLPIARKVCFQKIGIALQLSRSEEYDGGDQRQTSNDPRNGRRIGCLHSTSRRCGECSVHSPKVFASMGGVCQSTSPSLNRTWHSLSLDS